MYLKEGIDQLLRIYSKSFKAKSKVTLEKLRLKENDIDYEHLWYKKIYFSEEGDAVFHKIDFLKRHGTLYDLLQDVVTRKINIDHTNVEQLNFIINLMYGHNKNILLDKKKIQINKE